MPANCLFDFLPKHVYPYSAFLGIFVFFGFEVTFYMILDHFVGTPSGSMASTLPKTRARKKHEIQGSTPAIFLFEFLAKHLYPYSACFCIFFL